MSYPCFGQLLIVEAKLFLPFRILACRRCCALYKLILLVLTILIALRPVDLRILKSDFAIDVHRAKKRGLVLRELGFQNLTDYSIVLLEILLRPWFLKELLIFKLARRGSQRRILL
jgi:hypothetical protein